MILLITVIYLGSPGAIRAGVLVTDGAQYLEISGIYEFDFGRHRVIPYHDLLQASSTETLANSVSDLSFNAFAQLTGATSATQTVTPNGADATTLMLNTHSKGTSLALSANFAQSYNFGRDYLVFSLDAPHAFKLTVDLSGTSFSQGPGAHSTASSEAYLQLVGASNYVEYVYIESDDGGPPGGASQTFEGILDAGSYKLSNYSFASGFGDNGSSSSQDATGSVTLSFPTNGGSAIPEPASFVLLSLGSAGAAFGACWVRRRPAASRCLP